jgi:rRNA maturation endonuclease Nob1
VTYDLEAELCGTEHLKKAPVVQRTVEFYKPSSASNRAADGKIAGFFAPGKRGSAAEEDESKPAHENNFSAFEYWREPLPVIDLDLDAAGELLHDAQSPSGSDHFGAADLPSLEAFLQTRSFLCSYELSAVDRLVAAQLLASCGSSTLAAFCNVSRWLRQVGSYPAKDTAASSPAALCVAAIRRRLTAAENFNPEDVTASASSSQTVDDVIDEQHHQHVSSDEGVSMDDSDKENGDEEYDDDDYDDDEYDDGDDDDGWITPGNVKEKRAAMAGRGEEEAETRVRVACMTTDFAMQNVLKQIGLNIIGTNGMIIRVSAS